MSHIVLKTDKSFCNLSTSFEGWGQCGENRKRLSLDRAKHYDVGRHVPTIPLEKRRGFSTCAMTIRKSDLVPNSEKKKVVS
ncbi:hypothetical protein CEXT_406331 [Caerostris extrusa]|uniref:Uncharacterized protein n=1 Tax=Caerostris extrusa TaxID=172846 RepID=A0AAV4QNS8_CAEEX|nr:hypothetical protein CEXT_406331 [Caerostris extrusa]